MFGRILAEALLKGATVEELKKVVSATRTPENITDTLIALIAGDRRCTTIGDPDEKTIQLTRAAMVDDELRGALNTVAEKLLILFPNIALEKNPTSESKA